MMASKDITSSDLSSEDCALLLGFLKAIEAFTAKDRNIPIQMLRTFLIVATEEGEHGTLSLAERAGFADTVAARHLADLGELDRYKEEGLDFVWQKTDRMDRRYKKAWLTQKGKAFRGQLLRALKGK